AKTQRLGATIALSPPTSASAIRLRQLILQHQTPATISRSGDWRLAEIEDHAGLIQAVLAGQPKITLNELRLILAEHGVSTSIETLWRFFARDWSTRKKDRNASEHACAIS